MSQELQSVIGLFDSLASARAAVNDLHSAGYTAENVELVTEAADAGHTRHFEGGQSVGARVGNWWNALISGGSVGGLVGCVAGLAASVALPLHVVAPMLAQGPLTGVLLGSALGAAAGGLIGALAHPDARRQSSDSFSEGIRRGGTVVVVKSSVLRLGSATQILARHAAVDMKTRVAEWKRRGWRRFEPGAQAFSVNEQAAEQSRRRPATSPA